MQGKGRSNWLYMSRLAALKEFAFMQALYAHGFTTPIPIEHNRHIVAMSKVSGFPMSQIKSGSMEGAEEIFDASLDILKRLAQCGLVHCDFNEFNLMVNPERIVTLIDFPQMVSTNHSNAEELFQRDKNGLIKFFAMKMHYIPPDSLTQLLLSDIPVVEANIDMEIRAAGFTVEEGNDLEAFLNRNLIENRDGDEEEDEEEGSYEEDDDDVEEEANNEGAEGVDNVFNSFATAIALVEGEAGMAQKVAAGSVDYNDKEDNGNDIDDDISELGDEDPNEWSGKPGHNGSVLLEGEELERARREAAFKVSKKNGGRFSSGKKGGNQTKKINKYGKKVKSEKMSDMIM